MTTRPGRRNRALLLAVLLAGSLPGQEPQLPPIELPGGEKQQLSVTPRVYVRRFRFQGNTAFTENQLWLLLAGYLHRRLDADELEEARRALTLHYIQHGYINSGARLDDQPVSNGVITFTIVEGQLSGIDLEGNRRLRSRFLKNRIHTHAGIPLNMHDLQEGLLQLKENPNLRSINAELKPGALPGTSFLQVHVLEENPWGLRFEVRNDRPPSVGSTTLETLASHSNLSGNSDTLELRYGIARGDDQAMDFSEFDDWGLFYAIPVTARDTTLRLYYDKRDFNIVEEPFASLDLQSRSSSYGLSVRQPIYKTVRREVVLGITAEQTRSETFLLGQPFSLSAGAIDGKATITAVRTFQEWIERSQQQVLAFRSTFSWGLNLLDATRNKTGPDGVFLSWLGQAQYVRRLGQTQNQLILSTTLQWTDDPLLSLEQFSIGGASSVRGYRENQIVRDRGLMTSAELRLPLWTSQAGLPLLTVAPFFDYGRGWNAGGPAPGPKDLSSLGIGLIFTPHKRVHGKLYWGYPFRKFRTPEDKDLQDEGLHFSLAVSFL